MIPMKLSPAQQRFRTRFGPAAVITGASSGIGLDFARTLARAGFDLVLIASRPEPLNAAAREVAALGVDVRTLAIDLRQPGSTDRLIAATADLEVGLLVCSAGVGTSGPLIDNPVAAELAMLDLNCRSVLETTWHFARRFAAQRRGGIVLLSSLVAFQGVPRAANYSATKAYIQSLAEGLRVELAPAGVSVIACAPGPISTAFADRAGMTMGKAQSPAGIARATLAALGKRSTTRPGALTKLLSWSLATLPRWARVLVMTQVMKGMTPSLPGRT